MKTNLTLTMLLSCSVVMPVAAQQFEATINYASTDTDVSQRIASDSDSDRILVGGTYYFTPLDDNNAPLALADFFGRNSSVTASYGRGELETQQADFDLDVFVGGGRYVNVESGWFTVANFSRSVIDTQPDVETKTYRVAVGQYFAPTSIVSLGYKHVKDDGNGDSAVLTLSNFHAQSLGDDVFFDGGVAVSYVDRENTDDGVLIELASTYYPTKNTGVGLNGSYSNVDDGDTFTYGASAEWFIAKEFAISARYLRRDSDVSGSDIDTDTFQAGVRARF